MTFETRGYRSNQFLEAVRPDVHLKQKWFLGMEQLEIMYGGAAGGGKSDALLMAALQYVDIPHYAAIIFRRTYADLALAGALMDRATRWLSKTNALKRDGGKKWEFPGGGTLEFGYLDKDDDKYRYQSAEFQFCTIPGTEIRMADGSLKKVENLTTADYVATLEGPKRVTRVLPARYQDCVQAISIYGSQTHTTNHRFLTPTGWTSYDELHLSGTFESTEFQDVHKPSWQRLQKSLSELQIPLLTPTDQQQLFEQVYALQDHQFDSGLYASSISSGTEVEASDDSPPVRPQLPWLFCHVTLVSPADLSAASALNSSDRLCVSDDAPSDLLPPSSQCGCPSCIHSCGEQSQPPPSIGQGSSQQPVGAAAHTPPCQPLGVLANTPKCTRVAKFEYDHPYTKEIRYSQMQTSVEPCVLIPTGSQLVIDITIESASHYITSSNFINANCGFDELTQMPEDAYSYLFSRLRRPAEATCIDCDGKGKSGRLRCLSCAGSGQNPLASVPLRMRSATNPGGKYGEWVRAAFISKRYMQTPEADQFSKIWGKSAGCILCKGEGKILVREVLTPCSACGGSGKTKRYFVPARLEDNPSVDILSYEAALAKLTAQERAQLRHGRWDIVADGLLFKSGWFRRYYFRGEILVLQTPAGEKYIDSTKWFTFITADTASTVKSTSDYTVVCVWAYVEDTADICLVDVYRDKIPIPHILPAVRKMYEEWGCLHAIIENASSGIGVLQEVWLTQRGGNMSVIPFSPHTGDKVSRATEATIMAEAGKIYIPQQKVMADDDTLTDCFNELLQFDGADGSAHDDFVDNVSMAAWWAAKRHRDRQPSGGQGPGQMWRPGMPLARPRFSSY